MSRQAHTQALVAMAAVFSSMYDNGSFEISGRAESVGAADILCPNRSRANASRVRCVAEAGVGYDVEQQSFRGGKGDHEIGAGKAPVRPALHDLIRSLAEPDGSLPIWSRWRGDERRAALVGLDILARDQAALAEFEIGLPRFSVEWFEDIIELANWDHVPVGFIQTSAIHDHSAAEARRRNWPVARLHGTHLHPTLHPAETADAIIAMSDQLVAVVGR
jgi:hypothetical protein